MNLEFSKTIENVKSTYVFAKETLLNFLFPPTNMFYNSYE
jgi:hypothetical protein